MPIQSGTTNLKQIPRAVLPDCNGIEQSLVQLCSDRVSVIFFSCNHCPYVQWVEQAVGQLSHKFSHITWLAICSNDVESYPADDIPGLLAQSQRAGWEFPYLIDSDQRVAHAFGAVCTPDFYVFDAQSQLVYRGAFDSSRPKSDTPVSGEFLEAAIESALAGNVFIQGSPALGCGIKWLNAQTNSD